MSILKWLAERPGGKRVADLTWDQVGNHLRKTVLAQREEERRDEAALRQKLYRGRGDERMNEIVGKVFKNAAVANKRKEWISLAKHNNVWRRIITENATVYSVEAHRTVSGAIDQEHYSEVQTLSRQHEQFQKINAWGQLQKSLAVGFRVRDEYGKQVPVIDVVSRDAFFALPHPVDSTLLLALGIRIGDGKIAEVASRTPVWEVWTPHERFFTSARGDVLKELGTEPHGYEWQGQKRMPWLLFSLRPPAGQLIDHDTGAEIDSAHLTTWFTNICAAKETKSNTILPVLSGEFARNARDQAADSEVPIELKEGGTATVLDMTTDLGIFRDQGDAIFQTAAGNEGIAPGVVKHQGVQSAQARKLMRQPLQERRRDQLVYLRQFERQFAEVQSMVLAAQADLSHLAFSMEGWSIEFKESVTPLDPKTDAEVFEARRRQGRTSTIKKIMEDHPGMTWAEAQDYLLANVLEELFRNTAMRPLVAMSGSFGSPVEVPGGIVTPTQTGDSATPAMTGEKAGQHEPIKTDNAA